MSKYSRGWYYLDIGVFMEACKKTKLSNNFSHANMWSIVKVEKNKYSVRDSKTGGSLGSEEKQIVNDPVFLRSLFFGSVVEIYHIFVRLVSF